MADMYGVKGDYVYLISEKYKEAYRFSKFGEGLGSIPYGVGVSYIVGSYSEVCLVSVLGETLLNTCEILCNGRVARVSLNYIEVYQKLATLPRISHLVFKLKHSNSVSQILIPLKLNENILSEISKSVNFNLEWNFI